MVISNGNGNEAISMTKMKGSLDPTAEKIEGPFVTNIREENLGGFLRHI